MADTNCASSSRRTFLRSSSAVAVGTLAEKHLSGLAAADASGPVPDAVTGSVIDTHVHFYNPARPGGVPWPPQDDSVLYRTVLPADFRRVTAGLPIRGVIEIEASPLVEDNQWILDLMHHNPLILGTCGHLEIGSADFAASLERFQQMGRFLGIRIGSTWGRVLRKDLQDPETIHHLRLLAKAGLEADVVGGPEILRDVIDISDRVPDLRMVIDHMPFEEPATAAERSAMVSALREISGRPHVFCKVSNVLRRIDGRLQRDPAAYQPALDELWHLFGVDRLVYGSNWPVCEHVGPYDDVFHVVRQYFATKGAPAAQKFFSKNAQAAYRWASATS